VDSGNFLRLRTVTMVIMNPISAEALDEVLKIASSSERTGPGHRVRERELLVRARAPRRKNGNRRRALALHRAGSARACAVRCTQGGHHDRSKRTGPRLRPKRNRSTWPPAWCILDFRRSPRHTACARGLDSGRAGWFLSPSPSGACRPDPEYLAPPGASRRRVRQPRLERHGRSERKA